MIFLLQLKITKSFIGEDFSDIKFENVFKKLYYKLSQNDNSKYLPPRFSYAIKDLAEYYGIFVDVEGKGGNDYLLSQASTSSLTTISKLHSVTTSTTGHANTSVKSSNVPRNVPKISVTRNDKSNLETIKETVK